MKRGLIAVVGMILAAAAIALLARPLLQSLRADAITADLGIRPAINARARAVDGHVLAAIEARVFGRELRLRLARPSQRVRLQPFFIDQCEVPQIEYERFAKWQRKQDRAAIGAVVADTRADALTSISSGHRIAGLLQSPATGIYFFAAARYCAALGGRLPWAEELEAAASGAEGRLYAWGDEFSPSAWPYSDGWRNAAQVCGAHPPSDSPQGVHDLNANAMEWSAGKRAATRDAWQPAAHGAPAVRARGRALYALNAAWLSIPPATRSHHLGFRCVYDAAPADDRQPWGGTRAPSALIEGGEYALGLPPEVRLARLAAILPDAQLGEAGALLASSEHGAGRIKAGRCEVSRGEYQNFLNDPLARAGLFANPQQPADEDYAPTDWPRQLTRMDLPVSGMSWWAADAFARWAGGRLPSAREWQLLATGAEARLYPWGNQYDPNAAVTSDLKRADLKRTDLKRAALPQLDFKQANLPEHGPWPCNAQGLRDASADGARHLGGNLSEWTQSIAVDRGNYAMWVQGGNWLLPGLETARGAFGRLAPLNHRSSGIGLRVVYD